MARTLTALLSRQRITNRSRIRLLLNLHIQQEIVSVIWQKRYQGSPTRVTYIEGLQTRPQRRPMECRGDCVNGFTDPLVMGISKVFGLWSDDLNS
jgi:hypothetical protein